MARLPSKYDLSGPGSFRTGRSYSSADTSAIGRGMMNLGAGIAAVGQDITAEAREINEQRRRDSIIADIPPADASARTQTLDLIRSFETDTDFATQPKRFEEQFGRIVSEHTKSITDERARREWENDFRAWGVSQLDRVKDKATRGAREKQVVNIATSLDQYGNLYVDPDTPDDERERIRATIGATIDAAEQNGQIDAATAYEWRKKNLEQAELTFAKLWMEANPEAAAGVPRKVKPAAIAPDVQAKGSQAIRFFMEKGYSQVAAAGIVGNLIHESGGKLSTGARNPGDGQDGSDSIGLAQWNAERGKALKSFAASRGKDWTDFQTQLEFIDHELRTGDGSDGKALQGLQAAKTVDEAAAAFMHYERPRGYDPKNPRRGLGWSERLANAAAFAVGEVMDTTQSLPPNFDRMTPVQQSQVIALRDNVASEIERASEEQSKVVRQAVERQGYDLLYQDQLTPEWFEANKDDLGLEAYKSFARALVPGEDPIRTDPQEYLRLMDLAESNPEQAVQDVREAYADRRIAKDVFNRVYSRANANITDTNRRPYVSQIRQFVDRSLKPPEDASRAALSRHLDTMFLFDDWVSQNPQASREEVRRFADDLTSNQKRMLATEKRKTLPLPGGLRGTPRDSVDESALNRAKAWTSLNLQLGGMTEEQAARDAETIRQWLDLLKSETNGR